MYQQNAVITTQHQINTLLLHLKTRTAPPEGMLFFQPLLNANLDYTPESIDRLSRLLTQLKTYLTQKNLSLATLVSEPQSRLFFLSLGGYLGDYLAKSCDETLIWFSYFEARTEIDKKNRAYGTDFQLVQAFENSIVAKIGENMYCQPLQAVQQYLAGQGDISEFVAHLQQGIFEQAQVNLMAPPNQVCRDYLKKVQTGRLLDSTLGFFEQLKTINFDYSAASLAKLDKTFSHIKHHFHLTPDNYQRLIAEPAHQATLYLLGFYIGMTCARLTNKLVTWANYQQIYRTLIYANPNATLVDCIEHSFVMLVENGHDKRQAPHFVTPILVVTQSLFGIAEANRPAAPLTSSAFYQAFVQHFTKENTSHLAYFPYPALTTSHEVPKLWQIALQSASRLVTNNLMQIFDGSELEPQLFEFDPVTKKGHIQALASLGNVAVSDYLKNNPKKSFILATTQDTLINLPSGQCDAIAITIAVYQEPKLRLRLALPYRPADSGAGFAIYPLIAVNQALQHITAAQQSATLQALIAEFYQSATAFISPMHAGNFWQHYYIEPVNSPQPSPLQQQRDHQPAEQVTLTLLPVIPLEITHEPTGEPALEPIALSQPLAPQAAPPAAPITAPPTNQFYNQNAAPWVKAEPLNPTSSLEKTPEITPPTTQISPELLAQLRQDQARLQRQLSTSDSDKDRKIKLLIGAAVGVMIILMLGAWLMK